MDSHFGKEEDGKDLIAQCDALKPEARTKPPAYYNILPNKYFTAGEVLDPEADELLLDGPVRITNV